MNVFFRRIHLAPQRRPRRDLLIVGLDGPKQRLSDQADEVQKTIGQKVREGVRSATEAGRNQKARPTEGAPGGAPSDDDETARAHQAA